MNRRRKNEKMHYLDYFLEILKTKLINTGFVKEEEIISYGLPSIKKNFFTDMSDKTIKEYENGDGKEFESDDFKRIRSSAAMIFNLLGNENVFIKKNTFIPEGVYEKEFEKKYKTVNVKVRGKQIEANLDAWLYNLKTEIFIESKCLEWIQNSSEDSLKSSYIKNTKKYFYPETAEVFRKVGTEISLSQYDSCQMFKHSLAIYNYLKDNEIKGKKILLINVVWEPEKKDVDEKIRDKYKVQLELEHKQFNWFYEKMQPVIKTITLDTKNEFNILYFSVKDFYSFLEYSNEQQKKFVQRYL